MIDIRKIILFGYGNFGRQLYKHLSLLGYVVTVLSTKDEYIQKADDDGIEAVKFDITKNSDILALNIDQSRDLVYCAMNQTANNLFLVLTLRTLLPHADIIAISNSSENTRKLEYAGANSVIDLYEATSRRVVNILTKPAVTKALDDIIYKQNDIKMAEIELPQNSFLDGASVQDINFKKMGVILVAIIDKELGHELVFTDHRINHKLDAGDILVIVAKIDDLKIFKERVREIRAN
jgi:Trk K+ transport system NAD-binding subunit